MKYSKDEIRKAFKKTAPNFDDVPSADKLIVELIKLDWELKVGEVYAFSDGDGDWKFRESNGGVFCSTEIYRPLTTLESGAGELVGFLEKLQNTEWLDHDDLDAWKKQQSGHCKVAAKALKKWKEVRGE